MILKGLSFYIHVIDSFITCFDLYFISFHLNYRSWYVMVSVQTVIPLYDFEKL